MLLPIHTADSTLMKYTPKRSISVGKRHCRVLYLCIDLPGTIDLCRETALPCPLSLHRLTWNLLYLN
ncbi:hypothetical protein [Microcoleus sp. PH2017_16_JOR_D_A]|uniref:hypothetical protein n=1 Tax=Microcoleus sp. PH2017_16_JOR_D_A TaxID=2798827 RepID=UPI0025E65C8B|nr:hypothetical protein [Microcoleus sp. PH2017_16_JOR_D_A]